MGNAHAQNRDGNDLRHSMGIRTLTCTVTKPESNAVVIGFFPSKSELKQHDNFFGKNLQNEIS